MFKEFNFNELKKELDKYKFKQLHIHHTWKPDHYNFKGNNHQAMQKSMKNYHVNNLGWADIGQNLTLFPDGKWLEGRKLGKTPASIKYWNSGALAVEMIGNFDKGHDKLKGKQLEEILQLIKYFIDKYGESSVKFHREGPGVSKTCPGTSLNKEDLIKKARNNKKGEKELTKSEVLKIIKEEKSKIANSEMQKWQEDAIKFVLKKGFMTGYPGGEFKPNKPVTRAELAQVIYNIKNKF